MNTLYVYFNLKDSHKYCWDEEHDMKINFKVTIIFQVNFILLI